MYDQPSTPLVRCWHVAGVIARAARLALLVGCALVLAAWLGGWVLTDRYAWSQWLWWIPTPIAVTAAGLGLIGALIPGASRRRWLVRSIIWSGLFIALVVYFTMIEHRLWSRPTVRNPETTVRIVHLNASRNFDAGAPRVAAALQRLDPDVVLFTEDARTARDVYQQASLGDDFARTVLWPYTVLSRLPIVEARRLIAYETISLAVVSLQRDDDDGTLVIWLIDLPSDPWLARIQIARDVQRLLDEVDAPRADLIVGDFNITRGSASLSQMFPGYLHAYDTAGVGYSATFPQRPAVMHIDNTLHRPELGIVQYFIVNERLGEHHLQVIDLAR